jgi:imidazolonepropionase-like amidohydrolase
MIISRHHFFWLLGLVVIGNGTVRPLIAQDLAVKAKTIHTVAGDPIEDGIVLIRDGRIVAVGTDVEIPVEVRVIQAADGVVVPGYIDVHNASGMSQANENNPIVPFLNVVDSIDPIRDYFEECRRNGITTASVVPGNSCIIGGQSAIIKTAGSYVDDMLVRRVAGVKISLLPRDGSRISHLARLRKELDKAVAAIEKEKEIAQESQEEKKADDGKQDKSGQESSERPAQSEEGEKSEEVSKDSGEAEQQKREDLGLDILKQVVQGEIPVFIYCDKPQDVSTALRLKDKYQLDLIFVLSKDCHPAVHELKAESRAVILDSTLVFWETDEKTREDKKVVFPKIMLDNGVPFVFQAIDSGSFPTYGNGYFWYQAATAIQYGMKPSDALEALTSLPAKTLGIDSMVGSIEVGKDGDLVVLTGDPFDVDTWVQTTIVGGRIVYERDRDEKLERLLSAEAE